MEQSGGNSIPRWIISVAVFYLLLPNILFLLGWIHWYWALPLAITLLVAWVKMSRRIGSRTFRLQKSDAWVLPLLALGAAVSTVALGLHGHVPQHWDFIVRNPIYETLVRCDWPLYNSEGKYFVYYMAYWLPPAMVSKIAKTCVSPTSILWAWNFIGVLLVFLTLWIRWRKRAVLIMVLMCTLGSLNDIRRIYGFAKWAWEQYPALEFIEPYVAPFTDWTNYFFLGLWNQLACNTPHTALPVCMVIAIAYSKRLPWQHIPFVAALGVLWSPLSSAVLLPWVLTKILGHMRTKAAWKTALGTISNWAGVVLLFIVGTYYSCANNSMVHTIYADTPYYNDWMLEKHVRVLKAVAITGMMLLPIIVFLWRKYKSTAIPLLCCCFCVVLPAIWIGYENNELLFKGSSVVFMLLILLYASRFIHSRAWCRIALIIFFVLSAGEFAWDMGFRIIHKYTWDETLMKKHIKDDLKGHLNHPHHIVYKNFFGQNPPEAIFYNQPGDSATFILSPFATGKNAEESNPERLK